MKHVLFTLVLALAAMSQVHAQRIALVDIGKVLESMSDYQAAQKQLDQMAAKWRQEVDQEYDKIKSMYNKYQSEQVLMSDEMRAKREEEIMKAEKAARKMQRDYFGPEGLLFQKRKELVQPIQDRVYRAIDDYAQAKGLDIIFDMGGVGVIYNTDKYDKTEDIINKLKK